jgi:hypothetical protein
MQSFKTTSNNKETSDVKFSDSSSYLDVSKSNIAVFNFIILNPVLSSLFKINPIFDIPSGLIIAQLLT